MRIIAGSLKGKRLQGPPPGELAVRPTSDRAREALFSILEPLPRGAFLDLFAGTGAVGLEAWSRGHAPVTCVEAAPAALRLLRANAAGTSLAIVPVDAMQLKTGAFHDQALVFADPPYADSARILARMAPLIRGWLSASGRLVWECPASAKITLPEGFRLLDRRSYGSAAFHFLAPSS
jgi:16S rRNA (guanine966-N2)-methyltransferase